MILAESQECFDQCDAALNRIVSKSDDISVKLIKDVSLLEGLPTEEVDQGVHLDF